MMLTMTPMLKKLMMMENLMKIQTTKVVKVKNLILLTWLPLKKILNQNKTNTLKTYLDN